MKGLALIVLLFIGGAVRAQHSVQTIVPLQPITVGAAFQVQYIVTNDEPVEELQSPAFGKDFRYVSGPRLYQGQALINHVKTPIQNFSYTLIPLRKGRLVVKGATAIFKSGKQKSDDTFVVVTDGAKDDSLTATTFSGLPRLAPGQTLDAKLQEQIFIQTEVSKQSCFVGEPVVATFTLFSRLPSASEILKNPGFYGFSVLDLPDEADGGQTVQTHNGTFYNTHLLRHVQLYPMQAGNLLLDKMSVTNDIEYADSLSGAPVQANVLLESKALTIAVKPLPPAPAETFSGAVGRFTIDAYLDKPQWDQNSNGKLLVTLKGSGNFLQLSAPEIQWPKRLDVFEPVINERLQKDAVPVAGTRTYTYTFTADSTGSYTIPPITFTYFSPVEKKYKTIHTDSLLFTVQPGLSNAASQPGVPGTTAKTRSYTGLFIIALVLAVTFVVFRSFGGRKKTNTVKIPETKTPDVETAIRAISPADTDAYRHLQQELMRFLKSWPLPADTATHSIMQQAAASLSAAQHNTLHAIVDECEAVQYYNAAPTVPFSELQQQALQFIRSVKR